MVLRRTILSLLGPGLYVAGPGVFFAFFATSANTLTLASLGNADLLWSFCHFRMTEYFWGLGTYFECATIAL